ncbi:MAG: PDZ domain-containing protein [Desulfobacterales bacterium]|nr:MAG: PDZ domain-containing protein [Desulfobacterales bacterium]
MKRYVIPLNLFFITCAVYLGVKGFYNVSTSRIDTVLPFSTDNRQEIRPNDTIHRPLSYYRTIAERNLFNTKTDVDRQPEKLDLEALKPTDLKLKLLGTVAGEKKDTYAVIEEVGARQQNLYRVGDTIQSATLKTILRGKVILNVNGEDQILGIEKDSGRSERSNYSRKSNATPLNRQSAALENIKLKRSQIETAVQDINTLMKQVRIRPHFTNGEPDGLRVTGIRPNSIFYRMGLKSGDVITGVDGKNIVSVDDALKLYQSLQSSESLKLQLKRRGRSKTLEYNIE